VRAGAIQQNRQDQTVLGESDRQPALESRRVSGFADRVSTRPKALVALMNIVCANFYQ
jgi:hypothetical protein